MRINAIIVDDEKSNQENLANILREYCKNVHVPAFAGSVPEALEAIEKHQPKLVFLDIEMPGANGFDLLEKISNIDFEVVFVTAYDQYALKAIKFCALDYLLKPINIAELVDAVAKAENKIAEKTLNQRVKVLLENAQSQIKNKKIAIPTQDKIEFVEIHKIIRCMGENNYTYFYLEGEEKILVSKTLKEFEELLSSSGFLRVHRSHLVNLAKVKSFVKSEGGYLVMEDSSQVAISRNKKEETLASIKQASVSKPPN